MDLIVPHVRTDFDAFASMLCAAKLYPDAVPIVPSNIIYRLKEVLSLYRNVADFKNVKYVKKIKDQDIDSIIVVDTKKRGQLKEFEACLGRAQKTIIFDHHPPTADDVITTGGAVVQYPYGANTTGLFLRLLDQGITLEPQEATILLLGIYADTGNLTYPGTTPADAAAVSELLRLKADLSTVNHYLRPHFDPGQLMVFRDLLSEAVEYNLEGYKVVLVKKVLDRPQPGLSYLIGQVSDMVGADAILGLFATESKPGVQIIIQSLVPEIDAAEITGHFSGGGHPGAAAALLPVADLDGVHDTLMTLLTEAPLPTQKVRDLMTREVFTVPPDLPLTETAKLLVEKGVGGAPVRNEAGKMIGVISLRDVEKARVQDRLNVPTKAFMAHKVLTLSPDDPLIIAKKLISHRDIGHIPVMENSTLVGIISRTDILGALNNKTTIGPEN